MHTLRVNLTTSKIIANTSSIRMQVYNTAKAAEVTHKVKIRPLGWGTENNLTWDPQCPAQSADPVTCLLVASQTTLTAAFKDNFNECDMAKMGKEEFLWLTLTLRSSRHPGFRLALKHLGLASENTSYWGGSFRIWPRKWFSSRQVNILVITVSWKFNSVLNSNHGTLGLEYKLNYWSVK